VRRLQALALPGGELQERVVAALYVEALAGPELPGRLADAVGPSRRSHLCIEI
jgi:hypothetical protein